MVPRYDFCQKRPRAPSKQVHILDWAVSEIESLRAELQKHKDAEKQEPFIYVCANEVHAPVYLTHKCCWKCNALGEDAVLTALYAHSAPIPKLNGIILNKNDDGEVLVATDELGGEWIAKDSKNLTRALLFELASAMLAIMEQNP